MQFNKKLKTPFPLGHFTLSEERDYILEELTEIMKSPNLNRKQINVLRIARRMVDEHWEDLYK